MDYEVIFYPSPRNHGLKWNSHHAVAADRLAAFLANAASVGLPDYALIRIRRAA